MAELTATASRLERRKAHADGPHQRRQSFLADGNLNVPIPGITQAADVGLGSFYNHFESKEELFEAAVEDVLELLGGLLDELTADIDDPAVVFAQSFRLFGRFHRRNPEMGKVFLNNGLAMAGSDRGLAPRALRDIQAGVLTGRFTVRDPELALTIIGGASLCLGQFLHDHPERNAAQATDQVAEDLLRLLGVPTRRAQRTIALPPRPRGPAWSRWPGRPSLNQVCRTRGIGPRERDFPWSARSMIGHRFRIAPCQFVATTSRRRRCCRRVEDGRRRGSRRRSRPQLKRSAKAERLDGTSEIETAPWGAVPWLILSGAGPTGRGPLESRRYTELLTDPSLGSLEVAACWPRWRRRAHAALSNPADLEQGSVEESGLEPRCAAGLTQANR